MTLSMHVMHWSRHGKRGCALVRLAISKSDDDDGDEADEIQWEMRDEDELFGGREE